MKIKKILLLLISTLIFQNVICQDNPLDYTVIKVNGLIVIKKSNRELKTGLIFSDKESLLFKEPESKAVVINSAKGRLILTEDFKSKTGANYLPAMSNISSRGASIVNIDDLKEYIKEKIVIIENNTLNLIHSNIYLSQENYFYIRYKYKGAEYKKNLKNEASKLIFSRKELLKISGKAIQPDEITELKLYYYKDETSLFISEFNPVFPDLKKLKKEVSIILENLKEETTALRIHEVTCHINEFYGKIDIDDVKSWFENNFKL